jgi:hypothetical protein
MSTVNQIQFGGTHYKTKMQVWDFILANDIGYLEGTCIKYLTRWRKKEGLTDLYKARHFIDKLIEVEEVKQKDEQEAKAKVNADIRRYTPGNIKEVLVPTPSYFKSHEWPPVLWPHEVSSGACERGTDSSTSRTKGS